MESAEISDEAARADNGLLVDTIYTFMMADLRLKDYLSSMEKFVEEHGRHRYTLEITFYRLAFYYMFRSATPTERERLERIIADVVVRMAKSGQKTLDDQKRSQTITELKRRFLAFGGQVIEMTGLPFSRVRALRRLVDAPLTLVDLASAMSTDAPAATVAVNDLERRGLVARNPHPENRRAKLVALTPAGKQMVARVHAISEHAPEALAALSAADLAQMRRILEAIRSH